MLCREWRQRFLDVRNQRNSQCVTLMMLVTSLDPRTRQLSVICMSYWVINNAILACTFLEEN